MFSGMEWIVTLAVILIVFLFGGKKLPELARGMGRFVADFRISKEQAEKELKTVIETKDSKSLKRK